MRPAGSSTFCARSAFSTSEVVMPRAAIASRSSQMRIA